MTSVLVQRLIQHLQMVVPVLAVAGNHQFLRQTNACFVVAQVLLERMGIRQAKIAGDFEKSTTIIGQGSFRRGDKCTANPATPHGRINKK